MAIELNSEIKLKDVKELIPYARNSRTHDQAQVDQICASIKEFGFTNPILIDKDNSIIAGHGRLLASQKLGLKKVPTINLGYLSENQKKAYVIADNKLSLNAGWDMDLLKLELEDLKEADIDLELTGFDNDELNSILAEITEGNKDPDEVPETPVDPVSKLGDLWGLGNHRLLNGDSTQIDDLDKLMNGNKIDMVFTDPPYNVNYGNWEGNEKNGFRFKKRPIENDNMSDDEFIEFIGNFVGNTRTYVNPGSPFYICYGEKRALTFLKAFEEVGLHKSSNLIWVKQNLVLGRSDYHYQHEPIFYGWFEDGKHKFYGDRKQVSTWHFDRPMASKLHPTMKPVELIEKALENSSKPKDIVYEAFSGSGSTIIACTKLDRCCYAIELDPKYVDVAIERWQEFTGKEAYLISEDSRTKYNDLKEDKK